MSNYKSSSKNKMVAGIVLIVVLMMTAFFAGCVSEGSESKNGNSEEFEDQPDIPEPDIPEPDIPEVPDEGDGNESEPPETDELEGEGTIGAEGTVETLAQTSPETVTETVELNIPEDKITGIDFVIKVQDGDEETNPDEVNGSIDSAGRYTETLPQGKTPYTSTINIKPSEGHFLPATWTITLEIVCHASDDQWPGPIWWVGTPDHGFSYNVSAKYSYLI